MLEATIEADEKVGMDRQFEQLYFSQLQKLNKNLILVNEAQSIDQLLQRRNHLNDTIALLQKFPVDVKVYPTVQQTLTTVRVQMDNINTWLSIERKAATQLALAKQFMNAAIKQEKNAESISDYRSIERSWQEVENLLEGIRPGVFCVEDVNTQMVWARQQQNRIQSQISNLVANNVLLNTRSR